MPAFCIDIHFVARTQGFSQELRGSWDFSFSGKRFLFSGFTHSKRRETGSPWIPLPAFLFAYFSRRLCFLSECRVRDALAGGFIGLDNSVKLANAYFPCTSLLLWHWDCVDAPNMPPFYRDCPHPNPRASPGGGPEPAFGPAAALCFSQCSTVTSSSLFRFLGSGAMGR